MICGIDTGLDVVTRWGDPWHGLIVGDTLTLPGGVIKTVPGTAPTGGDCYVVQVPGVPAVTTSPEDTALGMTWLNYALMAGENHCVYGAALGAGAWLYVDPNGAVWRAEMAFNVGTRAGSIAFRRFDVFPDDGVGVVQTAPISLPGPFTGTDWQIDDIKAGGAAALVVTYLPVNSWPGVSGLVTAGHREVGGAFEVAISGIPPAALVSVSQLASSVQAAGSYIDTRVASHAMVNGVSIKVSNVGRFGHVDKLAGYCYASGVAVPVLRSLWSDQESYSAPVDAGSFLIDYTVNGEADHVYEIKIGSAVLQITGHTVWSGSGRVDAGFTPPSHLSGYRTSTTTVNGHAGYSYSFDGAVAVSYQANDSWIFTEAGDTDNYMVESSGDDPTVAIWPKRLANGLYGIARYQRNLATNEFGGTWLTGIVYPGGTVAAELSSSSDSGDFYATRHPVTGDVQTRVSDDGSNICFR